MKVPGRVVLPSATFLPHATAFLFVNQSVNKPSSTFPFIVNPKAELGVSARGKSESRELSVCMHYQRRDANSGGVVVADGNPAVVA
ncbi:hypothetical protein E2C01_081997 [Portunus trituberculatus]|uniref:Uncharacterized protein n=1 Tax=Portunus trituberculatus TaxID=210409 RepID=A0A5B7IXB1_PORTR|nr:hypothetical protein [Portunus trituberculatus]